MWLARAALAALFFRDDAGFLVFKNQWSGDEVLIAHRSLSCVKRSLFLCSRAMFKSSSERLPWVSIPRCFSFDFSFSNELINFPRGLVHCINMRLPRTMALPQAARAP